LRVVSQQHGNIGKTLTSNSEEKGIEMKARFKIATPSDVELDMTIRMSQGDWEKLLAQLTDSPEWTTAPISRLREAILHLVPLAKSKFERTYSEEGSAVAKKNNT